MSALLGYLKPRQHVFGFFVVILVLMFTPAAKLLVVLFPAGALYMGVKCLRRDTALFIEFETWLFFLTPFIRRVVDFRAGSRETVIISTPFLVLAIPMAILLGRWRRAVSAESAPFMYAIAAVLYGAFIACVHSEFASVATGLIMWLMPAAFGLYVFCERDRAPAIYRGFEKGLLGGTFVAGAYGLFQYFFMPAWDAAWMRSVEMVTIGKPEPMEVRVFSTLNSPQILAAFLLVGILVAYRLHSAWKYPILLAGISSLALSFARSAWVGLLAAVFFLAFRGSNKEKVRAISATVGCAVLIMVIMNIPEVSEMLSNRFSTFTDLQHDDSAQERRQTYAKVIDMLSQSPAGSGVGVDNGMSDAENDSSVVAVLLSLGLPGSLVFVVALGVLGFSLISSRAARDLPQLLGLQCCVVGLAVESPLNNVINGQIAFLLWSLIGLSYGMVVHQRSEISARMITVAVA